MGRYSDARRISVYCINKPVYELCFRATHAIRFLTSQLSFILINGIFPQYIKNKRIVFIINS